MNIDEFAGAVRESQEKWNREIESKFMTWWESDGRYIDPDNSDVDWYDKRKELAALAFIAAWKMRGLR